MPRTFLVLLFLPLLGLAAPAPKAAEGRGLFVLDNCDPNFKGKDAYADNLSYYDSIGKLIFRVKGFNNAESIGCQRKVAPDMARKCLWVCEDPGHRLRKLDLVGKELLVIKEVRANALAVDQDTGNLWVLTNEGTIYGHRTIVYSPDGKELVTHSLSGHDIVYDPTTKAFWIAGQHLFKVPADQIKKPLGRADVVRAEEITAFCASSLAMPGRAGECGSPYVPTVKWARAGTNC